nr:hypothetical protein [Tanacetum cinerariifolium]
CYLLDDYDDVGKLKAKRDIGVFVGYSKESAAFRIYNKRTLSKVDEASKKDLEDLFQNFYDEYFDSSKIMKSSTTNVETPINEEVFHESIHINMVPNSDETSTSQNVFNERLEDAYFDASTSFYDPSNVHTYYQPYPHEKKWTKDHPLHKIIGKSSNPSVLNVDEASKKDLEDLFQDFYDEYFDSLKVIKSSTTNVETPINEEVFHEVSESFQGESSSSSLNDDVQQSPEEVILPSSNTQSIPINMVPNGDKASTSHDVFNERLKDAYFDASTLFHDPSNVHTFYQPYPHEKKWTKDHPHPKIIGDPKSSVRTRGQLANSCLFSCLLSSIELVNMAEALRDADWVSAMQEELD